MSRRLLSVLIALVCILVSGAALTWVEDHPWAENDLHRADQDQWVSLDRGTALRITGADLGVDFVRRDQVLGSTGGRFVHVVGEIRAEDEQVGGFRATLYVDEVRYDAVEEASQLTPPGFISTYEAIFEVPTDVVGDLDIEFRDVALFTGYERRLRVRPGFTDQDVQVSRNQKVVLASSQLRVIA